MYQYPYGNAQQLNLDWILGKLKELEDSSATFVTLQQIANALISATYIEQNYVRSDIVFYNNKLYRANQNISAEPWTPAHWDEILLGDTVSNLVQYVAALSNNQVFNSSNVSGTHTSDALNTLKSDIENVDDALDTVENAIHSAKWYFSNTDLGYDEQAPYESITTLVNAMDYNSIAFLNGNYINQTPLHTLAFPINADILLIYNKSQSSCFVMGIINYVDSTPDPCILFSGFNGTNWDGWKTIPILTNNYMPIEKGGTGATTITGARNNLGMLYQSGDQITINSSVALSGLITSNAQACHVDFVTEKSLENINDISIITLAGLIRGVSGYLDNVQTTTDYTTGNYSASATKLSNNRIRISISKTSSFTNVTNNTPVVYWGNLSLSLQYT